MNLNNKTNLILVLILTLCLILACDSGEKNATSNINQNQKESSENIDKTSTENDVTDEEDVNTEEDESDETETISGPTTVKFAGGKTSKSYKNSITSGKSDTYYLTASAGQTMSINIKSAQENAGFTVFDPSGSELSGADETTDVREFSEELADSGKYKIVVSSGRNVTYNITFGVSAKSNNLTANEAEGGANKTVKFGKGNSSASYSNSIIRGEQDTYNLKAGAGQFMTVSVTSVEDNASFQIIAPNGNELVLDDTNWREELPASGNYKIIVGSGRGNATYKINFKVEQSPIDH